MNVNEIMTAPVRVCRPETSLEEVARMMWEGDCGAVPVVTDDNRPLGIVTDRDIAMAAMHNHRPLWELQASTVIDGQRPCCCSPEDSIDNCLGKMEDNEIRRILVTDARGILCGIVSLGDAVAFAGPRRTNWGKGTVSTEQLMGMLRKVSSHHSPDERPLMQI